MSKNIEERVCKKIREIQWDENNEERQNKVLEKVCQIAGVDHQKYMVNESTIDEYNQRIVDILGLNIKIINFLRDHNLMKDFI